MPTNTDTVAAVGDGNVADRQRHDFGGAQCCAEPEQQHGAVAGGAGPPG